LCSWRRIARQGRIGLIAARFRNRNVDDHEPGSAFLKALDRSVFPQDGSYCEVYQLWVDPAYRRRGLATALKRRLEEEAIRRRVSMLYTHTESANLHVIALNLKLGYQVVRRGPLWDSVERVSLTKRLAGDPNP
jgi:ribosomal protein S18 acetylase RimI-like enzyme